jgi:hypothetical protein
MLVPAKAERRATGQAKTLAGWQAHGEAPLPVHRPATAPAMRLAVGGRAGWAGRVAPIEYRYRCGSCERLMRDSPRRWKVRAGVRSTSLKRRLLTTCGPLATRHAFLHAKKVAARMARDDAERLGGMPPGTPALPRAVALACVRAGGLARVLAAARARVLAAALARVHARRQRRMRAGRQAALRARTGRAERARGA